MIVVSKEEFVNKILDKQKKDKIKSIRKAEYDFNNYKAGIYLRENKRK